MTEPIYPCLWFDGNAKEAAEFYCSVFKDAKIITENPMVVLIKINGQKFMLLNGGSQFKFNESISFVVNCDTQNEIDYYWEKLIGKGGAESMCGWLRDEYGVSWQIIPSKIGQWMADPAKAKRMMSVIMQMRKLDVEKLEQA
jgi:predicted 3-demethylubiquinone-9 3-methyltransferase (glyoxalase superfamily)